MKRTLRSSLLAFLALAALSLPAVAQNGRPLEAKKDARFLTVLFQLFGRLLPTLAPSHAGMDPDGKPASESPAPPEDPDAHAGMDPDGKS